jgi:hypothetical protein
MAVNKSQENKFNNLINTPSNDIESHYKIDYSFVANVDDVYGDKKLIQKMLRKSLKAYDENPDVTARNAKNMIEEFSNKESILKKYNYLNDENKLTEKGLLLTKLNGYEQIPIIDSIVNKDFAGMNEIQLAGVVAGLANLENIIKTDNSGFPDKKDFTYYKDDSIKEFEENLSERIKDYNKNIYNKYENRELKNNTKPVKHVYTWAELNKNNEDSTENWKELYSGDLKKTIRDEGSLFREIMQTIDLLKQIKDVCEEGELISVKNSDKKYYQNLALTAEDAINLINRAPASTDDFGDEIEEDN